MKGVGIISQSFTGYREFCSSLVIGNAFLDITNYRFFKHDISKLSVRRAVTMMSEEKFSSEVKLKEVRI